MKSSTRFLYALRGVKVHGHGAYIVNDVQLFSPPWHNIATLRSKTVKRISHEALNNEAVLEVLTYVPKLHCSLVIGEISFRLFETILQPVTFPRSLSAGVDGRLKGLLIQVNWPSLSH